MPEILFEQHNFCWTAELAGVKGMVVEAKNKEEAMRELMISIEAYYYNLYISK